jgi:GalNAc-alpha-(1->4)-GalNAc-alpha-(1->3)-diNAcBac-PP-undecaprenol alpha-1,4-N-acetyl-D-galactosaminyltransferase
MKITLVISSLSCGGAERVLVLLAKGFTERGYDVSVVTLYGKDIDFYKLPEGVSRLALAIMKKSPTLFHSLWNNLTRCLILRQGIKATQPDVVISFVTPTNILTLLSLIDTSYPVIVTEHCDPTVRSYGKIIKKLRSLIYPKAAQLVSVSKGVDAYFDWLPKRKKAVIYNPLVLIEDEQEQPDFLECFDPNKQWIVSMGRLTNQKGFDLLLSAFAKIANRYPDWNLLILGEGELRQQLEKIRDDLGLANRAILPGNISNPFPTLRRSQLFVMASRFEGFPMVHGEAMACGLPIISTDCPSGPREIIRNNLDGILVPNGDVSALATVMERLMSDPQERKRLATYAPEVTERFSLEKVMAEWQLLINEVIKES